eukprot:369888-Rhodomonas_salina.2
MCWLCTDTRSTGPAGVAAGLGRTVAWRAWTAALRPSLCRGKVDSFSPPPPVNELHSEPDLDCDDLVGHWHAKVGPLTARTLEEGQRKSMSSTKEAYLRLHWNRVDHQIDPVRVHLGTISVALHSVCLMCSMTLLSRLYCWWHQLFLQCQLQARESVHSVPAQ